jgi:hypothetical protein
MVNFSNRATPFPLISNNGQLLLQYTLVMEEAAAYFQHWPMENVKWD